MPSKPRLIFREEDYPNFNNGWIRPLVEKWFDMVEYDPAEKYHAADTVLASFTEDFLPDAWFRGLEQAGHRVIIDHLLDSDVDTPSRRLNPTKLQVRNGNWIWINTALRDISVGYDLYRPNRSYTHDFLCLMHKLRDHRDRVMQDLAPELETARWSYVERNKFIGDPQERSTGVFWEFYMNPQWYDSTCWHLVVESWMRSDGWFVVPKLPNYKTEVSEKSYKPLAYFHPFVIIGSVDTLSFLRRQGFETFDNLWSESYDSVPKDSDRLDTVLRQVKDIVKIYNRHWVGWDSITQEKLEHNHARFYDRDIVETMFRDEIIRDLQEFLAS